MSCWAHLLLLLTLATLQVSTFNLDVSSLLLIWPERVDNFGYYVELKNDGGSIRLNVAVPRYNCHDSFQPSCINEGGNCTCSNATCDPDGVRWTVVYSSNSRSSNVLSVNMHATNETTQVRSNGDELLRETETVKITQEQCVCKADFNNDGLTDIVKAEPCYTLTRRSQASEVKVFIARGKDKYHSYVIHRSNQTEYNFGNSVSCIGDINLDGYPDIAVGDPFEENLLGVLYIFLGGPHGINEKYSQRIAAMDFKLMHWRMKGFGMSISKCVDIDENYYCDLAIGAPGSSVVVLMRSIPVVRLQGGFTTVMTGVDGTTLEVTYCVSYTGKHVPEELDAQTMFLISTSQTDSAMSAQLRIFRSFLKLTINVTTCAIGIVPLKDFSSMTKDVWVLLQLELECNIETVSQTGFYGSRIIRDPEEPSRSFATINFTCDGDGICHGRLDGGLYSNERRVRGGNQMRWDLLTFHLLEMK